MENYNQIFVHEKAIIDDGAIIKSGTVVWAFSHIMKGAIVGHNCKIGENVFIESGVSIGNNVTIKNNVAIYSGVLIEDDVFLGPSCVFTNVINPRSFIDRKKEYKTTIIKLGSSIGANSTLVGGITVNKYAMIGAGSVVTRDVNPNTLVYGNPAKFKSNVCICGVKLNEEIKCNSCKKEYIFQNGFIVLKE